MADRLEMYAALDDIFNIQVRCIENKISGVLLVKYFGGHFIGHGSYEVLAKGGSVNIVSKQTRENGVIDYVLENVFNQSKLFYKTVFPADWSDEKVAESFWHVLEHGRYFIAPNGRHFKIETIDNVDVMIRIRSIKRKVAREIVQVIEIITALPGPKVQS